MYEINERIIELRKTLKLSQFEFSKQIGIKRTTLSSIEVKKSIVTERNIMLIIQVFNVNENWIRNGKGSMFNSIDSKFQDFYEIYKKLNPTLQEFIINVVKELLKAQDNLK